MDVRHMRGHDFQYSRQNFLEFQWYDFTMSIRARETKSEIQEVIKRFRGVQTI